MKNAIKLRIIHSMEYNAEAEYLLEFFSFIGCLVFDAVVDEQQHGAWDQHLHIMNHKDGVDIVLNYFGTDKGKYDCSLFGLERIFIYFSLEDKFCEVYEEPLLEIPTQKYSSKRLARQKALSHLIETIWYNDSYNKEEIEHIRELYIPTNGENDLFYILQAKHCFYALKMPDIVKIYNEECKHEDELVSIHVTPYVETMFSELLRMLDSLKGENPYTAFAIINTAIHILEIGDYISYYSLRYSPEISMLLSSISSNELLMQCDRLIRDNRWFITIVRLMATIYGRINNYNQSFQCFRYMLSCIGESSRYCDFIYYKLGVCLELLHDEGKANTYYQEAIKCNPLNYNAWLKLGYFEARQGHFKAANSLLSKIEDVDKGMLSPEKSLVIYEKYILLSEIALNSNREYSMKSYVSQAFIAARKFADARIIERIADSTESAFQDFSIFQNNDSVVTYYVFKLLYEWATITSNNYILNEVKQQLYDML